MPSAVRTLAGVLAALLLLPGLAPTVPAAAAEVVVAVLDTGIDPTHPEFAPDQVVAWWDFGAEAHPLPGATDRWDPVTPTPYDDHGHGTGTASLVAGRNVGAYPGAKLVVARLHDGDGGIVRVDAAIRWAVAMGADVVSLSIGSVVPEPGVVDAVDEAVRHAHDNGVLAVVAAGNGLLDTGVRAPSEVNTPSGSPYALVVGATFERPSTTHAMFSNTDPDVVAWGVDVCMARAAGTDMAAPEGACLDGDARYGLASGTSFSTPLVAGWAGNALQAARHAGRAPTPDDVRAAFLGTARDTSSPYTFEGHGVVDETTASEARAVLVEGRAPPRPSDANAAAAAASYRLRTLWAEDSEAVSGLYIPRPTAGGRSVVSASTPAVRDTDLWALDLAKGERVTLRLAYAGTADLDATVYRATTGAIAVLRGGGDVVATAAEDRGRPETIAFVAPATGRYEVAVEGWMATGSVAYTLTADVESAPRDLAFLGDHTYLGVRLLA